MHRFLKNRFAVQEIFSSSPVRFSCRGLDRWHHDRPVFVKWIPGRAYRPGPSASDRLDALSGVRHPLLSPVEDVFVAAQGHFCATRPFYEGRVLGAGPQPPPSASTATSLVSACGWLARTGASHGRLHPWNVLLGADGGIVLLDGGFPPPVSEPPLHLAFVAPEVLGGDAPDLGADLYSLGALIYRLYTGRDPFEDPDPERLRQKCLHAQPMPLADRGGAGSAIARAVAGLLGKNPGARHAAFRDLQRALPGPALPATRAAFRGRRDEVELAERTLGEAGPGMRAVVLGGDTGSGKTRLLEHLRFRAALGGLHLLIGRSFQIENRPFEPFLQLLEQRLRRENRGLRQWAAAHAGHYARTLHHLLPAEVLSLVPPPARSRPLTRGRIVADLVGALTSLSAVDGSTILALDDLQWADRSTFEVLEQLGWRAADHALRLVVATRPSGDSDLKDTIADWDGSEGARIRQLTLPPLSPGEAREIARQLTPDDAGLPDLVDLGCANPLFIEEYARCARGPRRVPDRVRGVLLERFRVLGRDARRLAELLALFDRPVGCDLLEAVLPAQARDPQPFESRLEAVLRSGLVESADGRPAYRHESIRSVVYQGIPLSRRRRLHESLLQELARRRTDSALLAFHAERAGRHRLAAEHYARAAGDRCKSQDYGTAIDVFARSKQSFRDAGVPLPPEVAWRYAGALLPVGLTREAGELLEGLLASGAGQPVRAPALYRALAYCHFADPVRYLHYAERALAALPADSGDRLASSLLVAQALAMCGKKNAAEEMLAGAAAGDVPSRVRKAVTLLALARYADALAEFEALPADPALRAPLSASRAVCLEHLGRLREAQRAQQSALATARRTGLLSVEFQSLANLGAFHTKLGKLSAAAACLDRASEIMKGRRMRQGSDRANLPLLLSDRAVLASETGDYRQARELASAATRALGDDRSSDRAIAVALRAAGIYGRTSETKKARAAVARVAGSELFASEYFMAERALVCGEPNASGSRRIAHLEECLASTAKTRTLYQQCHLNLALGECRLATGERETAFGHFRAARALAIENGYRSALVRIDLSAAGIEPSAGDRARRLRSALRQARRIGLAEEAAEAGFRLGKLLHEQGRPAEAVPLLRESVAATARMAAGLPQAARQRYLREAAREEARSLLSRIDPIAAPRTASRPGVAPAPDPFGLAYEAAVRISAASGVAELIAILEEAVTRTTAAPALVFLDVGEKPDWHSRSMEPDERLRRLVGDLHRRASERSFVGLEGRGRAPGALWIPLGFRRHRFGGIYLRLTRRAGERELEFLTTVGAHASTALAALLWVAEPPPAPGAADMDIIGRSEAIRSVRSEVAIACRSDATLLIEGESGTGKELVARAVHDQSARAKGPFVPVDCGAIPDGLIESELFGSRRGAFTGAHTDRTGVIESADGGTLFLDEISNTSPAFQVKLLRVLQEREVRRVGEVRGRRVDMRLIAASNSSLDALTAQGAFRRDLLYRLKVLHIVIPPLRNRRDDIPVLAQAFLDRLNAAHETRKRFHKDALSTLGDGDYPGNVRELQNLVERAYYSALGGRVIAALPVDGPRLGNGRVDGPSLLQRLSEGRDDFWKSVYSPYKSREISREQVLALVDVGLRETAGSYKRLAALVGIEPGQYRRFMDFLRRNKCQLDFRPYRRSAGVAEPRGQGAG